MNRPEPGHSYVTAAASPGNRELLGILVGAVVVAALYFAREVLIPVVSAILLAFVLAPFVRVLRRLRTPRVPAVLMAVTLSVAAIIGTGAVVGTQLAGLVNELPTYTATITSKVRAIGGLASGRFGKVASKLGVQLSQVADDAVSASAAQLARPSPKGPPPLAVEIHQPAPSPFELARQYVAPAIGPLATLALVFVVSVFILLQQTDLRDRLIRLFGSSDLHRTTVAMDDAAARLSRYFLTQLGVNALFGVAIGIVVHLIGVPHAVLWGVLSGLLRFVPFVGGVVSALLPAGLAAAVDPGWSMALWTLGLIWLGEAFTGQVLEPFLYGHSTGLSPVSVVVAAIFWAWVWGPIGLVLSTPVSLCLLVLGRHVPRLQFLEVMLGDRPPLTPPESFYQRLLAGDSEECLQQAESLMKEAPLSAYYDQVALKGLELAVRDSRRGVLDDVQVGRIHQALGELIAELADFDDVTPPPSHEKSTAGPTPPEFQLRRADPPLNFETELPEGRAERPVVICVAGRGLLAQCANEMLAQLLDKHGLAPRVVHLKELSREKIGDLNCSGVVAICLSAFQEAGDSLRLAYMLARLREKCPGPPVMIGLWGASEAEIADPSVGVDQVTSCVGTLRELVNACVEFACALNEKRRSTDEALSGKDAKIDKLRC